MPPSDESPRTMRLTNVRFPEPVYEHVSTLAASMGVSVAQYVREAVLIRLGLDHVLYAHQAVGRARGDSEEDTAAARDQVRGLYITLAELALDGADPEGIESLRQNYDRTPGGGLT